MKVGLEFFIVLTGNSSLSDISDGAFSWDLLKPLVPLHKDAGLDPVPFTINIWTLGIFL